MIRYSCALSILALAGSAAVAQSVPVSVKLTTNALGLGTADLNDGNTAIADIPGKFITSATTGEGSRLFIQRSGVAGSGTGLDPHMVTITSRTHLDTLTNLPAQHDYQAGVIYLSNENTSLPDGRDEGLGVRAFTVGTNGLRTFSGGRAVIEGSKEVSGGTGPSAYLPADNGPPHVDEDVTFTFAAGQRAVGPSVSFTLSKFETGDRIWLTVEWFDNLNGPGESPGEVGHVFEHMFMGTSHPGWSTRGSNVWDVNLGGLGFLPNHPTAIKSFTIRAVDDDPANPRTTAEHFLITGFTASVPAPGPTVLAAMAAGLIARRRRR
ncbi:MAG: hypothetical protein ACT4PL_05050 [Phycisphaerales bacterium]